MPNSKIYKGFEIPAEAWRRIGEETVVSIIVRTGASIDRDGKRFPAYSARYVDRKAAGFVRKRAKSKPNSLKGVGTSRRTVRPDFRLTGETLNGTRVLAATRKGFAVGWTGGGGFKVGVNEERGKYKIGGFSKIELQIIDRGIERALDSAWKRQPGGIDL